jgi:hypothetical protein
MKRMKPCVTGMQGSGASTGLPSRAFATNRADYGVIRTEIIEKPVKAWRDQAVQYIYALALDESAKAKSVLGEVIQKG